MIELNKKYSLTELKQKLGISKRAWDSRREEILEYLNDFFDYKIIQIKNSKYFIASEIYADYQPLPRARSKEEIQQFYKEETEKIVEIQPVNTGSNIARIVINSDNKFHHAETTATRYIRPVISEEYDKTNIDWYKLNKSNNTYIPLTEEQIDFITDCYNNEAIKNPAETLKNVGYLIQQYREREISKQDFADMSIELLLTKYEFVMKKFKAKYGFRPMLVSTLVKKENTPT